MGTSIRVAHISDYQTESTNGVEKTVAGLVSSLPCYGVESEVWHFAQQVTSVSERGIKGVRVFDLPAYDRPWNFLRELNPSAWTFVQERQRAVHLLHFHSGFIPENVWLASAFRKPYMLTPNGGYSPSVLRGRHRWSKRIWLRMYEQAYIQRAARVHAVSTSECNELRAQFCNLHVVVMPNAIDLPGLSDGRESFEHVSPKYLLFLGRLAVAQKGLDRLLQGYTTFLEQTGDQETRLILAGPDFRGGLEILNQLIKTLRIAGRVSLVGPVFSQEKWALLRGAHAFVHPSRWEGMPLAILEALAVGCPVLITPETNVGEIVRAHHAGVTVQGSPEEIARGLQTLLSMTREHYASMRQRARWLVELHFTWSKVVGQIAQAYCEVVEGRVHDRGRDRHGYA